VNVISQLNAEKLEFVLKKAPYKLVA